MLTLMYGGKKKHIMSRSFVIVTMSKNLDAALFAFWTSGHLSKLVFAFKRRQKVSLLLCAWLYYGQNENTTSGFQP